MRETEGERRGVDGPGRNKCKRVKVLAAMYGCHLAPGDQSNYKSD